MAGLINQNPTVAPQPSPQAPNHSPPAPPPAAPAPQPGAAPPPQADPSASAAPPAPGGQQAAPTTNNPITDGPVDPEVYKKMTANCMNVVTHGLKAILQSIGSAPDKPGALATAAVHVLIQVEDSFEASGGKLVLTMSFNAGAECLIDIADACEKAGIHQFGQKELDAAFLRAVDRYRVIRAHQGRINQADFQQQLQQMQQEANDGTLEQKFPGLNEFTKQNQAPQQGQPQPGAAPADAGAPPAPSDGDGPDNEAPGADADTPAADPSQAGTAPAPDSGAPPPDDAAMPAAGQNIPAHMLKPTKSQHVVASHLRRNPGTPAPKVAKAAAKAAPAKAQAPAPAQAKSNDFPAHMLKKGEGKPAAKAKAKPLPKFLPKKGGV